MTQTIQPMRPDTFRIGINPKLLEKARNFFNASLTDILNELLQNARRAGSTHVAIAYNPATMLLTVADDGSGIFRDSVAIDLGGSGWDGAMQASEDPAGCGLFSLASRTCLIESWGKKIALNERKFCGQEDVAIEQGDDIQGTRISFPLTEFEARSYRTIAQSCALYYPLPVLLDGEQLPRRISSPPPSTATRGQDSPSAWSNITGRIRSTSTGWSSKPFCPRWSGGGTAPSLFEPLRLRDLRGNKLPGNLINEATRKRSLWLGC
jgi:hypothetical protein